MTRIPGLTIAVGAMSGYAKEKGAEPNSDLIQKWFFITTPFYMMWYIKELEHVVAKPVARVAIGVAGGAFMSGLAFCIGSKFGQITADFTERAAPVIALPPRAQPRPSHPLPWTSWPLGASPYAPSGPRSGSSDTEMR